MDHPLLVEPGKTATNKGRAPNDGPRVGTAQDCQGLRQTRGKATKAKVSPVQKAVAESDGFSVGRETRIELRWKDKTGAPGRAPTRKENLA
jgi:hypothetical protein